MTRTFLKKISSHSNWTFPVSQDFPQIPSHFLAGKCICKIEQYQKHLNHLPFCSTTSLHISLSQQPNHQLIKRGTCGFSPSNHSGVFKLLQRKKEKPPMLALLQKLQLSASLTLPMQWSPPLPMPHCSLLLHCQHLPCCHPTILSHLHLLMAQTSSIFGCGGESIATLNM